MLGKAPPELVDGLEAVKAAQRFMLNLMNPGADPREIFATFNEYMRARNLPEETRLNAHGMGYDMVERPLIRSDELMKLATGMCVVVHPGFINERMFAVVCDNYFIEDTGAGASLHRTPQTIIEL